MYTEFIIGYILMGCIAALLIAVIILLCIILKKISRGGVRNESIASLQGSKPNAYSNNRGVVICRNCATQYDSVHTVCPKCGTQR